MSKSRNERRRWRQRKRSQRAAEERHEQLALLEDELHQEWQRQKAAAQTAEPGTDSGEVIPPTLL